MYFFWWFYSGNQKDNSKIGNGWPSTGEGTRQGPMFGGPAKCGRWPRKDQGTPPNKKSCVSSKFPFKPNQKGSMAACTMPLFTFNFLTLCLIAHKVKSPSHKPKTRPSTRGSNFMPRPEIHRTKGSDLSGSESRQTPSDRLRVGSRGPGRGHAVVLPRPSLGHARRRETPVAV